MRVTVWNCAWHYNKGYPEWGPLDMLIIHFKGLKIPAPKGIVVHVPSASVERDSQPKVVMVCVAKEIHEDPLGVLHIR
jgi:hypothetical protein